MRINRDEKIEVKVSVKEKASIEKRARDCGLDMSKYFRALHEVYGQELANSELRVVAVSNAQM